MSTIIVTVLACIFAARYYVVTNDIYKTFSAKRRENARSHFFEMAAILVVANIVTALVTKPVPILALVLAAIYFAFVIFLIINVKMRTNEVPVYDCNGKKVKVRDVETGEIIDKTVDEPDKLLTAKQLFTVFCLGLPMAVNVVFAKASLVGNDFSHPWKTLKGLIWFFIIPLLITAIIAVVHFIIISGGLMTIGDWLKSDDDDDDYEIEEPAEPSNSTSIRATNDEYEDISSNSPHWYQRANWIKVGCVAFVATVIVVCSIILLNEFL